MKIHDDQNMSTTEAFYKIIKVQDKIKYNAFGKVNLKKVKDDKDLMEIYANRNKVIDNINDGIEDAEALATIYDKIASQIIASQRKELVSEIEAINKVKHMKGQVAAIFDIKNKILGNKKKPEREATAVINYRTREL